MPICASGSVINVQCKTVQISMQEEAKCHVYKASGCVESCLWQRADV